MQFAVRLSELPPVDAARRADLKAVIEAMPAARHLGIEVKGFGEGGISRVEIAIEAHHTFAPGLVQAGVIGALADFAGVGAAASTLEVGAMASTVGFEVHNLAPARGERLIAVGQALLVRPSHGVSRVDVYAQSAGEDRLALVGFATTTCRPIRMAMV